MEQIVYKQRVSTDRSTLETYCASAEEFVDTVCEKLELLRPHSFVAREQASFYAKCKSSLQPGEILVTADVSENYSFVLQDAAQGFDWNNSQATLHPSVAYFYFQTEFRPILEGSLEDFCSIDLELPSMVRHPEETTIEPGCQAHMLIEKRPAR